MFLFHVLAWQAVAHFRDSQKVLDMGVLDINLKEASLSPEEAVTFLLSTEFPKSPDMSKFLVAGIRSYDGELQKKALEITAGLMGRGFGMDRNAAMEAYNELAKYKDDLDWKTI